MDLDEYIRTEGKTVVSRFGRTFTAAQHPVAFDVMEQFIREIKPDRILEIGTANGGLTSFINHVGKETHPEFQMISTDIFHKPQYEEIRAEGVNVLIEDIFDKGRGIVINDTVLQFLAGSTRKIVLCDGGNKPMEFQVLSQYLNVGDFILAHDYVDTEENFRQNVYGKLWCWQEIKDAHIDATCKQHNLVDYQKDVFSAVFWACKVKVDA